MQMIPGESTDCHSKPEAATLLNDHAEQSARNAIPSGDCFLKEVGSLPVVRPLSESNCSDLKFNPCGQEEKNSSHLGLSTALISPRKFNQSKSATRHWARLHPYGSVRLVDANTHQRASTRPMPHAAKLVQHAVYILGEIWPCEYVPTVFHAPWSASEVDSTANFAISPPIHQRSATIISHLTQEIPCSSRSLESPPSKSGIAFGTGPGFLSLEGFVHYVLRRSRTTCSILSSALCYIEALRNKVPSVAMDAQGTPAMVEENAQGAGQTCASPSPLLCPRRTFVAAIVIASKCLLDHCFSNRFWAKICGLPPREISMCERKLCEALEWRLWVGKNYLLPKAREQHVQNKRIDPPSQ